MQDNIKGTVYKIILKESMQDNIKGRVYKMILKGEYTRQY